MKVNRCLNCMEEMNGTVCPHCGFDVTKMVPESYCLRPNTILKGRYLIGRSIGRGGFGITYIGFDLVLDVKVAVKEYFPSGQASRNYSMSNSLLWTTGYSSQDQWQSGCDDFLREARKMAKISAIPSIVRVMDTFTENSTAYIVMEYVEGVNLKQYLERRGLLSFQDCVKLLKPLIMGLEKAHQQGLIHRDISPDNIMVKKDGSVCLLDLGAAKDLSVSNKAASKLVTKNGFSPLEQYSEAGGIGPWTDVYAMCATIYYCLTGKKPQDALDRMEKDELNLDIIQPPLTPGQKKALSGGLALRRQDRIQDMGQLLTALESGIIPSNDQDHKHGPVWKRVLPVVAVAGLVCIIGGAVALGNKPEPEPEPVEAVSVEYQGMLNSSLGRSPSFITIPKEWEYHTDASLNLYISQYDEENNTFYIDDAEMIDSEVSAVNVGDEYIYYIRGASDEGEVCSIVQMNFDGSDQTVLISYDNVAWLQYVRLSDGRTYLYYELSTGEEEDGGFARLYRYNLETGEDECVLDGLNNWYSLYDEYLYYIDVPGAEISDYSDIRLMRADVDGQNSEILDEENALSSSLLIDGMLFMGSLKTETTVLCDLDGQILDNSLGDLQTVLFSSGFAYGDGWIFYEPSGSGELHRVLVDGSSDSVIYQGSEILDMCYYDGYLLAFTGTSASGPTGAFLIYRDGSEVINVGSSRTEDGFLYEIVDGGVNLTGYEGDESDVAVPAEINGMEVVSIDASGFPTDSVWFYNTMRESELTWEEAEDGSGVVITSYSGEITASDGSVAVPAEIDGRPVVAIGDYAMQECEIYALLLPEGLVEIGEGAFENSEDLTRVVFPESTLTTIGAEAFMWCESLSEAVLPESLETVNELAFSYTALTDIYIPSKLELYGGNPFGGSPIENIKVSEENTLYEVVDGVLFANNSSGVTLRIYPAGSDKTDYTVPENVDTIGSLAFAGAENLTTVSLPDGLLNIYSYAFYGCDALNSINISDSVEEIKSYAFGHCSSLQEISVPSGAEVSEDVGVSVTYR